MALSFDQKQASTHIVRKFTIPAHSPRSDSRSLQYRDAKLDIVYNIQSQELPNSSPVSTKLNLVFLHGAQLTKESWNYWVNMCFDEFGSELDKCIAMDYVHHGDSAVVNENKVGFFIHWEDLGRDTACVIRDCINRNEIHANAPIVVVAHSIGGTAAMSLDVFEPGLVSGLVLFDPVWCGAEPTLKDLDAFSSVFAKISRSVYKRARDSFKDYNDYHNYMDKDNVTATVHPQIKKDIIDASYYYAKDGTVSMKTKRVHQAAAYYAGLSALGIGNSTVRRVRAPTLIVHGDIYNFNSEGVCESLESILPDARRTIIPDTNHMLCCVAPVECFKVSKDFMRQVQLDHNKHVKYVNSLWGPSAEANYLAQTDAQIKGGPAGLSKL